MSALSPLELELEQFRKFANYAGYAKKKRRKKTSEKKGKLTIKVKVQQNSAALDTTNRGEVGGVQAGCCRLHMRKQRAVCSLSPPVLLALPLTQFVACSL